MANKHLKTTLTLKLTIITDAGDSSIASRVRDFVDSMAQYDGANYEVIEDQCGDNTVIRHNGLRGHSFTFRDMDCFFERVFELSRIDFLSTIRDKAHLESVNSSTEETVETEEKE